MTTQSTLPSLSGRGVGGEGQTCTYCPASTVSYPNLTINPPMCATHYDLCVLVEYLTALGKPITIETVQAQLTRALDSGGQWTFTPAQVPDLLPAYLAVTGRKEAAH